MGCQFDGEKNCWNSRSSRDVPSRRVSSPKVSPWSHPWRIFVEGFVCCFKLSFTSIFPASRLSSRLFSLSIFYRLDTVNTIELESLKSKLLQTLESTWRHSESLSLWIEKLTVSPQEATFSLTIRPPKWWTSMFAQVDTLFWTVSVRLRVKVLKLKVSVLLCFFSDFFFSSEEFAPVSRTH